MRGAAHGASLTGSCARPAPKRTPTTLRRRRTSTTQKHPCTTPLPYLVSTLAHILTTCHYSRWYYPFPSPLCPSTSFSQAHPTCSSYRNLRRNPSQHLHPAHPLSPLQPPNNATTHPSSSVTKRHEMAWQNSPTHCPLSFPHHPLRATYHIHSTCFPHCLPPIQLPHLPSQQPHHIITTL